MPAIINSRIDGLRITVHDVFYYRQRGRNTQEIASILNISPEQVQAADEYIQAHRQEVWENYVAVEERNARGNPPEIEAKLTRSRAIIEAWKTEYRRRKMLESNGAGNSGGR